MVFRDIREHWGDKFGSLSGNTFIYHEAGMILNPFWEWQPVQFFKELFRRCREICFQNHPRGSFLKLYKSCQVSISSNYTSKIEHWENMWVTIYCFKEFWSTYFDSNFISVSLRLTFQQTKSICCSQVKFLSIVMPKCFCALTDSIPNQSVAPKSNFYQLLCPNAFVRWPTQYCVRLLWRRCLH